MKKQEEDLFFELCRFKNKKADEMEALLQDYASPSVLGHLFFNRMQAIAYGTLKDCGLLGLVNREFRNSLAAAHQQNSQKNNSFFDCLGRLCEILSPHTKRYAMLKGALLCQLYPEGYRTSNDVDLLVRPKDVTVIGETLQDAGFRQGHIQNGEFVPASRREIVESKMLRGETVPYILEVNLPQMRYFEVDINFSLDYKNGDTDILSDMLAHTVVNRSGKRGIVTLDPIDFFIHLCTHLYKETTTLPWVKMKRDMTLYKFCDLYMLLHDWTKEDLQSLFQRAEQLGMSDICRAAIVWTDDLFGIRNDEIMENVRLGLLGRESILHEVIAPTEHKKFIYTERDTRTRFFAEDRTALLKEVR